MEIKILQVFLGADGLPYKDQERTVHFPIVGSGFQGASNTTKIRFYYDELVEQDDTETAWVACAKLPNGKIGSKVLETDYDSTLGEHYALLELDSFYFQYKGDVYISLQGYQGGVQVDYDEETELYTIYGTPTIAATGSIKLSVNYATQFVGSGETSNVNFQRILADLGTKLGIRAQSEHVEELPSVGQNDIFYVINDDPNNPNLQNIYVWNENTQSYVWVGDNTLDLGEYYTKEEGETFEENVSARVTSVENELTTLGQGGPKGTYATASDLETADPDHDYVYLVTADNKWYYWNGTAWAAGGTYLTATLTDYVPYTVFNKLFKPTPNNLINYTEGSTNLGCGLTVTRNGDGTFTLNGTVTNYSGYSSDRLIALTGNSTLEPGTYTLSAKDSSNSLNARVYIRDTSGNDIQLVTGNESASFTLSESKTVYLSITARSNGTFDNVVVETQVEKGPATEIIPSKSVVDYVARKEIDNLSSVIAAKDSKINLNRYDINNLILNNGNGATNISFNETWENGRYTDAGVEQDNAQYIRTKEWLYGIKNCVVKGVAKNGSIVRFRVCTKSGDTYTVVESKSTDAQNTTLIYNLEVGKYLRIEVSCGTNVSPTDYANYIELSYSFTSIYDDINAIIDKFGFADNDLVNRTFIPYKFKPQAHRGKWGGSGMNAQNTIGAFTAAGQMNVVYAIETDVQQTSDGVFVCYHDIDLSSLTTGSGAIKSHTLAEVQSYSYRSGTGDLQIPTFEDYLKVCRKYGKVPYIELKILENDTNNTATSIQNLLALIKQMGFENRCVFTASSIDYVVELRKQTNKYIVEYMLLSSDARTPAQVMESVAGLSNIVIRLYTGNTTEQYVKTYHASGYLVECQGMTTFDETTYNNMINYGVEGCTCNDWSAIEQ